MRQPSSGLARGNGARDPRQNLKSYERNTPPHLGLAGGLGGWVVGGWWVGWLGWLVGLAGLVGWLGWLGWLVGWWLAGWLLVGWLANRIDWFRFFHWYTLVVR